MLEVPSSINIHIHPWEHICIDNLSNHICGWNYHMHEKYRNHENYYHKPKKKKTKTIHNVRNLNIDPQPKKLK